MKSKEVAKLIKSARDGATGSTMSLGELLRISMRLGSALSNTELTDWSRKEASGYSAADGLPDYRVLSAEARGDFLGPFNSGLKNAQIPKAVIDKKHQEVLFQVELRQPVQELEVLSRAKDGETMLSVHWSGDAIAYYQRKEMYSNGLVLASAWNPLSTMQVAGIVETIRTRVLDFMIQIEAEMDLDLDAIDNNPSISEIAPQQVTNIFNNTINGGNVAMSNTGNAKALTVNVTEGDMASLESYLKTLGVNDSELQELKVAVESDPVGPVQEPGPKVSKWLSKLSIKGIKGGLSVGKNVVGTLLAEAIMQYYGMK